MYDPFISNLFEVRESNLDSSIFIINKVFYRLPFFLKLILFIIGSNRALYNPDIL